MRGGRTPFSPPRSCFWAVFVPAIALGSAGCGGTVEGLETPVVLAGDDVPPVQYDRERRELVLAMLPIDLPAGAGHDAIRQAPALTAELPVGGWLNGYTVEVVDGAGKAVPRATIHHVNIMAPDRREFFSDIMQRVGAVGAETAPVRLPRVLGYPIAQGERLIVVAELHNPTENAHQGVRVVVRLPHTPDNAWPKPIAVQPFYMDVTPPAAPHAYDLPPGRSETSWEGKAPLAGRILGMGGHLHDHAVELRLEDVTADRVIWSTQPILDERGRLTAMAQETFLLELGLPVEAGHTYRLVAVYDNPTGDVLVEGGMGALGGIMMPSGDAVWPDANHTHPEYIEDVAYRITDRDRAPVRAAAAANGAHSHH
jgi:hypothetical protein